MVKLTFLSDALEKFLPSIFFDVSFFDVALWQWSSFVILLGLVYFLSWAITKLLLKIIYRVIIRKIPSFDKKILRVAFAPFRLGVLVALFAIGVRFLVLAEDTYHLIVSAEKLFAIFALTWLVFRVVDAFSHWIAERLQEQGRIGIITMLPLGRRTTKIAVTILAVLTVLQNLGVHVTALIAGLGVGGIAVALAAQKTLENLLGGVMLILDQPIRVGDACRFGTQQGTVEEIGLRTTKVRTTERTVVSIPNSDFSQMQLESFAARDRIRLINAVSLRRETTPDQIRYVLVEIRRVLYAHPKVDSDPARVRLVGFGAYSLDIEIHAYILTSETEEFMAVREDILLRIMDIVSRSGTGFAFPSQTTYLAQDAGRDDDKTRQAEREVQLWRDKDELSLPEFTETQIEKLDDTLDYPPRGSAKKNS